MQRLTSTILVAIEFGMIFLLAYRTPLAEGNLAIVYTQALGLFLAVWSFWVMRMEVNVFPELLADANLVTTGPYALVRHPMYLAIGLTTLAWVFIKPDLFNITFWLILSVVLIIKGYLEESYLASHFSEYREYQQKVKAILPLII